MEDGVLGEGVGVAGEPSAACGQAVRAAAATGGCLAAEGWRAVLLASSGAVQAGQVATLNEGTPGGRLGCMVMQDYPC